MGGRTRRPRGGRPPISVQTALCGSASNKLPSGESGLWGPAPSPGSGAPRDGGRVGAPRAGAGRSGRVTAGLTYSGCRPRSGGPRSQWAGARARGGPAGGEGEPAAGGRGGRRGRAPNLVPSGSPTTPAAGPSSSGGERSGSGQATQLREGSRRAAALRHPALARPVATMPKRKVSSGRVPHTPTPPPGRPQSPARPRPAALGRGGGRTSLNGRRAILGLSAAGGAWVGYSNRCGEGR